MGRPQRPYQTSWGQIVPGLYKCPDGRWRITADDSKFTQHDERLAVQHFLEVTGNNNRLAGQSVQSSQQHLEEAINSLAESHGVIIMADVGEGGKITLTPTFDENAFWSRVRQEIMGRPEYAAKMTGLPGLASLRNTMPKDAIKLADILGNYRTRNPSYKAGNNRAVKAFEQMMKDTKATTLDDLSQTVLSDWRDGIETSKTIASPQTRKWMYGAIKAVIAFNLKCPNTDTVQLRAALDRCKLLWTEGAMPNVNPTPISKEHFHALLQTGNGTWRAWLLMSLNACLHMDECCNLKWDNLDLEKGTYTTIRNKTRAQRIPRAAVLWSETVEAIRALKKTGSEYVFVSMLGCKFSRNGRVNDFADLRARAGLPSEVTFDSLRDGSYTAACHGTTDDRLSRVLAGHAAPGMQDSYVLRNPEIVKPACDAVYKVYGPFPPAA